MLRPSFCGLNFTLILILYTRGNLTRGWGLLVHFVSKWGSFSEYWHRSCSGQLSVAGYFKNTASEIFKKKLQLPTCVLKPVHFDPAQASQDCGSGSSSSSVVHNFFHCSLKIFTSKFTRACFVHRQEQVICFPEFPLPLLTSLKGTD